MSTKTRSISVFPMPVRKKNALALAVNGFIWRSWAAAGLSARHVFTLPGYETSSTGKQTGRFAIPACKLLKALIVRRVQRLPKIGQYYGLDHRGLAFSFDCGVC